MVIASQMTDCGTSIEYDAVTAIEYQADTDLIVPFDFDDS